MTNFSDSICKGPKGLRSLRGFFFLLASVCVFGQQDGLAQQLVFIHYTNETDPAGLDADNHRITIERLEQIDHVKARAIADNLRNEPKLMSDAISADRKLLRDQLSKLDVILCEVDNRSTREGFFQYWLPAESEARTVNFHVAKTGDYIFDENPLATAAGLHSSLQAISQTFSPSKHRFVLVTLSHGSSELALTVKLARKHEDITTDEFQAMFSGQTIDYPLPDVGVSKAEYFDILAAVGRETGMHFPLIVMESCQGVMDAPLAREMPDNVDLFFSSGHRNLEFRSLPFDEVFASTQSAEDLIPAMDRELSQQFLRIERATSWPIWIWSVPLIIVLLWQWFSRRTQHVGID